MKNKCQFVGIVHLSICRNCKLSKKKAKKNSQKKETKKKIKKMLEKEKKKNLSFCPFVNLLQLSICQFVEIVNL